MSKTKTYMQERGHWTKQTTEGAEEKVPKTPKNNKVKNRQKSILCQMRAWENRKDSRRS